MRSLSIVIPARDEAGTLPHVVRAALGQLDLRGLEGEVVVVDDGSADSTPRELAVARGADQRVVVVRHERSRGYGAALRAGFAVARGEHLFFTDADGQFDLADLGRLLPFAAQNDLVVGYRSPRSDRWPRTLAGAAWTGLADRLLGVGVRDLDCAFKLFHRRVLELAPLRARGAAVNAELLALARAARLKVQEVPIPHHPRRLGRASGGRPMVVLGALAELAAILARPASAVRAPGQARPGRPLGVRLPSLEGEEAPWDSGAAIGGLGAGGP